MAEQSPESLLLERWRDGDEDALDQLTPLVYDELKKLARSAFRQEQSGHTLQATALVNEAYLQLIKASVDWKGKAHFYALAAPDFVCGPDGSAKTAHAGLTLLL